MMLPPRGLPLRHRCFFDPQLVTAGPVSWTRSAKFSSACMPVESIAVILAEPKNNDRRQIRQAIYDHIEFVSCAEQEGTMDPEDADVRWDFFVLQNMHLALTNISAVTSDTVVVCVTSV